MTVDHVRGTQTDERVKARWTRLLRDPLWSRRVVTALLATATLLAAGWFAVRSEITELTMTGISVGIALVFGMITALQNEWGERRRTTIDLLANFSISDSLSESDAVVARRLVEGSPIGPDVEFDFDQHLMQILDYYEFLCRSAYMGALDRRTLAVTRRNAIRLLRDRSRPYVEARRLCYGPDLYSMIDWFVDNCLRRD